jgi:hypothetical protein
MQGRRLAGGMKLNVFDDTDDLAPRRSIVDVRQPQRLANRRPIRPERPRRSPRDDRDTALHLLQHIDLRLGEAVFRTKGAPVDEPDADHAEIAVGDVVLNGGPSCGIAACLAAAFSPWSSRTAAVKAVSAW